MCKRRYVSTYSNTLALLTVNKAKFDDIQVSTNGDLERKISGHIQPNSGLEISVPVVNHRRKRYSDLKSVYEKREEMRANEPLMRSYQSTPHKKAEKFEF